jgi:hypothetical protein
LTIVDLSGTLQASKNIDAILGGPPPMRTFRHLLGRPPAGAASRVEFCERCGSVCDQRCRADALLEQMRTRALTASLGLLRLR